MKLSNLNTLRPSLAAAALLALTPAAFSQATLSGSTLTVNGSPSDDVITVVFDVLPGVATVFGVPGTPDGTQFTGVLKLVARTFDGADTVNVQSLSATPPELDLDTGAQESTVLIDIQTPFGLLPTYSKALVRGGVNKDTVKFQVTDNAFGATFDWIVFGGEGENEATVTFNSDVLGGATTLNWRYFGGALLDKVGLDFNTKADTLNVNGLGLMGASGDEWVVKVNGDSNTTARVANNLRLGAGGDTALVDVTNCATTIFRGGIEGGEGDDTLSLVTSGSASGSPLLLGGLGNDTTLINVGQALLAGSSPRQLAGEGNDTVSMLVGAALLGTPFSDGGPGNDSFTGVGAFVNFE
jgi:hypothetical protein